MAEISRVHGQVGAGQFFGYTPLVILVSAAGKFTADTGGAGVAIVEGGYAKALKAVQTVGSVVWLAARAANTFAVIVDQPTFNQGDGVAGSGVTTGFGALKAALAVNCGGAASDYTVTSGSVFAGDGTFTLA
jgi:hypothetical protein